MKEVFNHLLPFSLSKALEGYKVVDELGREARVVAKLSCESQYPVVVIRTNENGEYVQRYSTEGICNIYGTKLYMVAEQETEFYLAEPIKGLTFHSEKFAKRCLEFHQSAEMMRGEWK